MQETLKPGIDIDTVMMYFVLSVDIGILLLFMSLIALSMFHRPSGYTKPLRSRIRGRLGRWF